MRLLTRSLLAAVLVVPVVATVAAVEPPCAIPTKTSSTPIAASCGLALIGAVEVSADGGLGQMALHEDLLAGVQRDDGQIALIDVADPTAPSVLGRYDGGTGNASLDDPLDGDVVFSDDGTILFHARQTSDYSNEGLHVLDVTDPTAPARTDFSPQGGMLRVAYARLDATEVVATQDAMGGLTLFEVVRTPLGAKVLPLWIDPLPGLHVGGPASAGLEFVAADPTLGVPLLYATDGELGLRVFDLSDLRQPVLLGSWSEVGLAAVAVEHRDGQRLVHVAREYWFNKAAPPELLTLDATDLSAITETTRRNLGGYDGKVAWKLGGLELGPDGLTIAHGHAGAMTVDLSTGSIVEATTDLGTPTFAKAAELGFVSWYAMDVLRSGDRLFVSDAVTGELRAFVSVGD